MDVFKGVMGVLSELSGSNSICLEQELQKDLGLDSLGMVTMLIMLEDTFEIILEESDMNPFDLITVSHVVNLVKKYIGGDINKVEG